MSKGIACDWDQSMQAVLTPPDTGQPSSMESISQTEAVMESPMAGRPYEQGLPSPDMSRRTGTPEPPQTSGQITYLPGSTINANMTPAPGPFPDWTFVPDQWTPMGSAPFEFAPSIELEDIDLRFLDDYNVNIPFELADDTPGALSQPTAHPAADPCRAAALGSDAFHNSHWRFRPNAQDHGAAEEHNLSLPADHTPAPRLDRRATGTKLSVSSRDRILTMVADSCRPENLSLAVASFPSVELLDSLLQYSLTSPVARFDSFLHAATFNPGEKRPELLAAMAAGGAVLTADSALTKLGHAIQETLRSAIPKAV